MKRWLTYFLKWIVLVVIGLPFFLVFGWATLAIALPMRAIEWAAGIDDGFGRFVISELRKFVHLPKMPGREEKVDA